jgi:D-lactate dehydrogenase
MPDGSPAREGSAGLLGELRSIVGRRYVLSRPSQTKRFATGFRYGSGPVLAVVRPGTPREQYDAFRRCIAAGVIVIVQAANTGLTGGSTPDGTYDRPVVIINTLRLGRVHLLKGGEQVICLAGATLYGLERSLAPLGREPHSNIGSSCIGASVVGGVCNNSGGALVRRGPAFTQYALYARVTADGRVELINHLGVALEGDAEDILDRLADDGFASAKVVADNRSASAQDYGARVRDVDAPTPARFNADPAHLFEASGSAGKVMVLAVRLDTFAKDASTSTFYVGTNDPAAFTELRRRMLRELPTLPIAAEYLHRGTFDIAERYGKDTFLAIQWFGTDFLPHLFALRGRIDNFAERLPFLPRNLADRLLQSAARLVPNHLPPRLRDFRDRFEHHLMIKVSGHEAKPTGALLESVAKAKALSAFECTPDEATKAFLHRFAAAGAANRYRAIHADEVEDLVAIDFALTRNDPDWTARPAGELAGSVRQALYYGHFFCHVFHHDYLVAKGHDPAAFEAGLLAALDHRGAEYPAEHNVGHHYAAKPALAAHYRALDPGNHLNPGIGRTSRQRHWL